MATRETPTGDRVSMALARFGLQMNGRLRQALATSGLSPRHGATLVNLAVAGPTSQQALLDQLAVDPSGLVAILNDLERAGLIERRRDPADRRRHIVEITAAGCGAASAVDRALAEVEAEAFADLEPDEMAQLRTILTKVRFGPESGSDTC